MSSSIYHLFLSHSLLSLLISSYSYPFFYLATSFQAFLCVVSIFICFRSLSSLLISSHLISSLSSHHFTHPVTSLIYMLSFAVISPHLFSFISMFISCDIFFGHLFIFIYLLSFSIISTHPFSIASYVVLATSFLCFFSCFICLCLLSSSIISTHRFSIPSLLMFFFICAHPLVRSDGHPCLGILSRALSSPLPLFIFTLSHTISFPLIASHLFSSPLVSSHLKTNNISVSLLIRQPISTKLPMNQRVQQQTSYNISKSPATASRL